MKLPDFLTQDALGYILLIGHRIGLDNLVYYYNQGYSPERLHEEYPFLSLALIQKVIGFYLENRAEVDAYVAREQKEMQRQRANARNVTDFAELERRMEGMGRLKKQ